MVECYRFACIPQSIVYSDEAVDAIIVSLRRRRCYNDVTFLRSFRSWTKYGHTKGRWLVGGREVGVGVGCQPHSVKHM